MMPEIFLKDGPVHELTQVKGQTFLCLGFFFNFRSQSFGHYEH